MSEILYVGFGELMNSLQSKLSSNPALEFREIMQLNSDVQQNKLAKGDVFLIGPYTVDPVRQVQRAHQQDPQISIILLIFGDRYQKIKQQIQFAYNVGKNATFVLYESGKDITPILDNAVLRTKQRRSFARIQQQQNYPPRLEKETTYQNLGVFLENAPIGAILFDEHKHVLSANFMAKQQFASVFKNRPSTISWEDLFPGEVEPSEEELSHSVGKEPLHEIIKVNNHFLEINISPVKLENNKPHYLLLINDITEKIKVENQLKSKIDELEFLNQELDEFVNVVSHDFKTPLTSISLLAELALKDNSPEKQTHFLTQIRQASRKLRELFKGLAVLVDSNKGRSEKVERINFQESLDLILTEYKSQIEDTGGEVILNFSAAPEIYYYRAHINSLFNNLLTNAIKYRREDVPLRIDVTSRKEKEYYILSVKDNGMGMDLAKNMIKLFQPFKRLTNQGTGSGLGLSIVKRMIEKDQGYLEVFSEPGIGTEFKVYLKDPTVL